MIQEALTSIKRLQGARRTAALCFVIALAARP